MRIEAFRAALERLQWEEGRNIQLDYRWGAGNLANGKTLAAELVDSAPDAIVIAGDPALAELHRLTASIPIVFTQVSDPVGSGFVGSLARPAATSPAFRISSPRSAANG